MAHASRYPITRGRIPAISARATTTMRTMVGSTLKYSPIPPQTPAIFRSVSERWSLFMIAPTSHQVKRNSSNIRRESFKRYSPFLSSPNLVSKNLRAREGDSEHPCGERGELLKPGMQASNKKASVICSLQRQTPVRDNMIRIRTSQPHSPG